jgi:adenylosuccinate lyase
MDLNQLTAVSPIDGRYRKQVSQLDDFFSEYGLIKYRVLVEVEYFFFLADQKFFKLPVKSRAAHPRKVLDEFSVENAQQIKDIESITNHDVKAVEYFLKEQLDKIGIWRIKRMDPLRIDLTGHQQHRHPPQLEALHGARISACV